MKTENKCMVCSFLIVVVFIGIIVTTTEDNIIIEGTIEDMKISGNSDYTLYIIEIDSKDYEISHARYNSLKIGDKVRIWKYGNMEIL
jgi:hypothetical protein